MSRLELSDPPGLTGLYRRALMRQLPVIGAGGEKLPDAEAAVDRALAKMDRGQRRVGILGLKARILKAEGKPVAAVLREQLEVLRALPGPQRRPEMEAKIERELGWRPRETFETGLRKTVAWYLENRTWWERVRSGGYRGERLGLGDGAMETAATAGAA